MELHLGCDASSSLVAGVVNVRGQVIPVVDIGKRFLLPERDPELGDQLIVARTSRGGAQ